MAVYALLPESFTAADGSTTAFSPAGRATLAALAWMACWWLTEAIDIAATSLLPLALFPLLGVAKFPDAAKPYADGIVFLFLGGFIIAQAMHRWGLDRRIALFVLAFTGTRPPGMIAGVMLATAFLSMWVSNTATAAMMLPIATSVVALVLRGAPGGRAAIDAPANPIPDAATAPSTKHRNFATAMLLGMAYAASIGGLGTIIGSPPNGIVVEFVARTYGVEISFVQWMAIGIPLVCVFLPICWGVLLLLFPTGRDPIEGGAQLIARERADLGRIKPGEIAVAAVFMIASTLWIVRPWLVKAEFFGGTPFSALSDGGIAIGAALVLFAIPVGRRPLQRVITWRVAERLPWGVLILFGGGLSLASAIEANGVDKFLATQAGMLHGVPAVLVVLAITAGVIVLSELASNTATAATMMPLVAALAPTLGMQPEPLLFAAGLAASCGFMLPVATPPNAIVFGSGHIRLGHMYRAGLLLDLIGALLTAAVAMLLVNRVVG